MSGRHCSSSAQAGDRLEQSFCSTLRLSPDLEQNSSTALELGVGECSSAEQNLSSWPKSAANCSSATNTRESEQKPGRRPTVVPYLRLTPDERAAARAAREQLLDAACTAREQGWRSWECDPVIAEARRLGIRIWPTLPKMLNAEARRLVGSTA